MENTTQTNGDLRSLAGGRYAPPSWHMERIREELSGPKPQWKRVL